MSKIMRGVDNKFAEAFMETAAYDLLKQHRDELFLGIRNGYINIYYRGSSICKCTSPNRRKNVEIAKRYLDLNDQEGTKDIPADDLKREYENENIKNNINDSRYAKKFKERIAQQQLVIENNKTRDSEWVCVDIEYEKQFEKEYDNKNTKRKKPGRFDIIAVTKEAPHSVALIELKCGTKAIGGDSGIVKHAEDYYDLFFKPKGKVVEEHLIPEIIKIVISYRMLFPDHPISHLATKKNEYCKIPKFYFITLENTGDQARDTMRNTMRKY